MQGKTEAARHFYERVLEIHNKQHISVLSGDLQQEAQIHALLWCEIGWTWYGVGNNAQTYQCSEKAERVLLNNNILSGPAWAKIRFQQSYVRWQEGRYEDGFLKAQEALHLFQKVLEYEEHNLGIVPRITRTRRTLVGDPVDLGHIHRLLAAIAIAIGQSKEAQSHLNTALTIAEQYEKDRDIANVCCNLADLYLRRGEHSLAQSTLRRSLGIAEHIGDIPLICVAQGNLGVLAMRSGGLMEAESWFKQSIKLAEQTNDPVYSSIFHAYLSVTFQEQGKSIEARKSIYCSLHTSRSVRIAPCTGLALVALGSLYTTQAIAIEGEDDEERIRLLKRARTILQRGLMLEDIEAETKTEGKLMLAQVALLLGELASAQQQALQTLQEAKQYELTWLVARTQRVLGSIMAAAHEHEQARQYFEQALRTFQKRGMFLEEARTLRERSAALLSRAGLSTDERHKALQDLRDAHEMFMARKAALDAQITEHILNTQRVETKPLL
ncbi:MAG: hypothetical protein NVS4B11_39300 [Ktedonobacteraceae bacterium]